MAILLVILGYGVARYYREAVALQELLWFKDRDSAEVKRKYDREITVLRETADDLRRQIEEAPAVSGAKVRTIVKYRDREVVKDVTTAVDLPPGCAECLAAIEIPYHFDNSYVVLDDTLRFNPLTQAFDSVDRKFVLTDRFNDAVVSTGLQNFVQHDDRWFHVRWAVGVDYTWVPMDRFPGLGVGPAVELVNLKKLLGAEVGINLALMVVPNDIKDSHVSAVLDWRVVRNAALGVGYGRSIGDNLVAAQVVFFPFD